MQQNAFPKHVVLAAGQSQRACTWPRDCRDKRIVPTYPLALQELWALQETGHQKGNFEKGLVNVNFDNFFVATIVTLRSRLVSSLTH